MRVEVRGLGSRTKRLASRRVRYYVLAWRGAGAPVIGTGDGRTVDEARAAAMAQAALGTEAGQRRLQALRDQRAVEHVVSAGFVDGLVTRFLIHMDKSNRSDSLKASYRRYLDNFREHHGDWRVRLFERAEIVSDLIEWRSQWADHPRSADYAISAVSALFGWARSQGFTKAAPTADIASVYASDRSDIIWRDEDLKEAGKHAGEAFHRLLRLAAATGLRKGDLIALPWSAVGQHSIALRTAKRKRLAVIPLTPEARAVLAEMPRTAVTVATNERGRPWTAPAVQSALRRVQDAAPKLRRLHFHDLRGTACTAFRRAGYSARRIALIMSWSEARVETLIAIYCSGDDLALAMLAELEQERNLHTTMHTAPDRLDREAGK